MADVTVVLDEAACQRAFNSWGGMVGIHISEQCQQLESLGRMSAGFQTGALIAAINTEYGHTATGGDLEAKCGVNPAGEADGYALPHHEGARPHVILPRFAKVLRFRVGGMIVFAQKVMHPGNAPREFLTRWLSTVF